MNNLLKKIAKRLKQWKVDLFQFGEADSSRYSYGKAGFSLIEMVVAIGLFAVAILLSSGLLLSLSVAQRQAITARAALDNAAFAFEIMTKEIRTGYTYHCTNNLGDLNFVNPQDCAYPGTSGGSILNFTETIAGDVRYIIYRLQNGRIEKSSDGGTTFLPLTAPEVTVTRLKFYVRGSSISDNLQPVIVVAMTVSAGDKNPIVLNFETVITQLKIDR